MKETCTETGHRLAKESIARFVNDNVVVRKSGIRCLLYVNGEAVPDLSIHAGPEEHAKVWREACGRLLAEFFQEKVAALHIEILQLKSELKEVKQCATVRQASPEEIRQALIDFAKDLSEIKLTISMADLQALRSKNEELEQCNQRLRDSNNKYLEKYRSLKAASSANNREP